MKDIFGNEISFECLGCSIIHGDIIQSQMILFETNDYIIHQDPLVPLEGFLIITSKRHISSLCELTDRERYELIDLISDVIRLIKMVGLADKVTVMQEERSNHLHVWLFPCKQWMEDYDYNVKEICNYLKLNNSYEKSKIIQDTIVKMKRAILYNSSFLIIK